MGDGRHDRPAAPLIGYLGVVRCTPPEVQETVALLVLTRLPEIVDQLDGGERLVMISDQKGLVTKLRQWLQPHELDRPRDDVGKVVIFRALIDLVVKADSQKMDGTT